MKTSFDCKVLYSDTDSLLCRIIKIDVYEAKRRKLHILQHFDCSNYPPQHPHFPEVNEYISLPACLFKNFVILS